MDRCVGGYEERYDTGEAKVPLLLALLAGAQGRSPEERRRAVAEAGQMDALLLLLQAIGQHDEAAPKRVGGGAHAHCARRVAFSCPRILRAIVSRRLSRPGR